MSNSSTSGTGPTGATMPSWGYWALSTSLMALGAACSLRRMASLWGELHACPYQRARVALLWGHLERESYRLLKQVMLGALPLVLLAWGMALPEGLRWGLYMSVQALFLWTTVRDEITRRRVERALTGQQNGAWTGDERRQPAGPR